MVFPLFGGRNTSIPLLDYYQRWLLFSRFCYQQFSFSSFSFFFFFFFFFSSSSFCLLLLLVLFFFFLPLFFFFLLFFFFFLPFLLLLALFFFTSLFFFFFAPFSSSLRPYSCSSLVALGVVVVIGLGLERGLGRGLGLLAPGLFFFLTFFSFFFCSYVSRRPPRALSDALLRAIAFLFLLPPLLKPLDIACKHPIAVKNHLA